MEIEEKIRELTPEMRRNVEEFIDNLLKQSIRESKRRLSFSWRGAIRELREKYTSVMLQHKLNPRGVIN